jgi:hypothetical protein
MTASRPPLRLVDASPERADEDDAVDARFEAIDRPVHDLYAPYREPAVVEDGGDAEEQASRTAPSPRFAIAALVVFQALAASTYLGKYAALTHGDDQYKFAAGLSIAASACLYAGTLLLALRPGRGRTPFIVAAVAFGLSLPAWGVGYGWSWPMAFGAILALAGAWFARAEVRPDDASAAQP